MIRDVHCVIGAVLCENGTGSAALFSNSLVRPVLASSVFRRPHPVFPPVIDCFPYCSGVADVAKGQTRLRDSLQYT